MNLKKLTKEVIENKKVLLRADLDVPVKEGRVVDSARLEAVIDTLEFLFKHNAQVILIGHLGRPDGEINEKYTLKPVADWYAEKYNDEASPSKIKDFDGWLIKDNFALLENLRYFKQEESGDEDFSKRLAELGDVYVNDAFAVSHRSHSSLLGVTKFIPHFAGFRLQKEVEELSRIMTNPDRPLAVIIGGAKIETKLPLVEKMHGLADYILVGGEIAEQTKILLKVQEENTERKSALLVADMTEDGKDISENSAQNFAEIIKLVKTVVWNGPVGLVEDGFDQGTKILANEIADSSAYSVVGGGDTGRYLKQIGVVEKFSFVSMGGGAMLDFLSGQKLPGIEALKE